MDTVLTETQAAAYAAAVHAVLVEEFPHLAKRALELIVLEQVGRYAEIPRGHFELVVDEVAAANWRLYPDHTIGERWRVELCCCKHLPSATNRRREERINEQLRAIQLES